MTKEKIIHARIDDDIHSKLLEKCNELGCSLTQYIESVLSENLEDKQDEIKLHQEPNLPQIKVNNSETRVFDCRDGFLYENEIRIGNCSDYLLDHGKVYDNDEKFLGTIQEPLRPIVTRIE